MQNAALGGYQKFGVVAVCGVIQQFLCRSDDVGQCQHHIFAFGVCQHFGVRVCLFQLNQAFHRKLLVHMACAVPQQHIAAGGFVDVTAEVAVGTEDEFGVFGELFHNFLCVARCYHHVGQCFDGSGGVDIRDDGVVGMCADKRSELVGIATIGQRTSGVDVGHQHFFVGRQYFGRFAHKMDAAHHQNVGGCFGSPLCQRQTIAYHIGYVLNVAGLVIVRHDDGIFFEAQAVDFGNYCLFFHTFHVLIIMRRKVTKKSEIVGCPHQKFMARYSHPSNP